MASRCQQACPQILWITRSAGGNPTLPAMESDAKAGNRVGGGVTPTVRPHHRAYGTVHGGSREPRPSLKKIEKAQESPFRQ